MKKEIIDHVVGTFTDFAGNERKFIVAAVSSPINNISLSIDGKESSTVVKSLSIGFAICNLEDEFNEEIGLKIAVSKAKSDKNLLKAFTLCAGMVNTHVVRAWMEQEIQYFINNPESHIPGYNEAKYKYFNKIKNTEIKDKALQALTKEQVAVVNQLNSYPKEVLNNITILLNEN